MRRLLWRGALVGLKFVALHLFLLVLLYLYKVADGGNHTTHGPVIRLLDSVAQPLEAERLIVRFWFSL